MTYEHLSENMKRSYGGRTFIPEAPPMDPRRGAYKIWHWWENVRGEPPAQLDCMKPGKHQRKAGKPTYIITDQGNYEWFILGDYREVIANKTLNPEYEDILGVFVLAGSYDLEEG